ncbi:MAG: VanZ family protein [Rhodospirillaceae bacterium]|nr:VanZ family protein [Rhodospirillaceae bacterium]MBT5080542.1 VanZ family protein [Rhodospirillaceae bacterium]
MPTLDTGLNTLPPKAAPGEKLAWALAVLWSGIIYATIPFTGDGVSYVKQYWDDDVFAYVVIAGVIVMLAAAAILLLRRQRKSIPSYLWLITIAAVVINQVIELKKGSPAEAIHFLQYGLLSLLLFRAFSHRIGDYSIYVAVTITGSTIGMLDETIQWLTQGRYFGLEDIWLNFTAVALVQAALALGIKPRNVSGWPDRISLQRLCRLGAAAMAGLGLCFLNTPDVFPDNHGIMIEYGFLHGDEDNGTFRSRLLREDLHQQDTTRAVEGGQVLAKFRDREKYDDFLAAYTPLKDPFLHEARVHMYSRNVNLERARKATDEEQQRRQFTSAHWENRILEDYFGRILTVSNSRWPDQLKVEVKSKIDDERIFISYVSRHLITAFSRQQAFWGFLCAVLGLLMLARHFGRPGNAADQVPTNA